MNERPRQGSIIIVTGPSGVGKDTICNELLSDPALRLERLVTYASRDPRPGEKDGVDYHFVKPNEFESMVDRDEFAEHTRYGSTCKGTARGPFLDVLAREKNYLWRIDPQRAATVYQFYKEVFPLEMAETLDSRTMSFYLGVDRLTTLYSRARARESMSSPEMRNEFRKRARHDWEVWEKYGTIFESNDAVLMNTGHPSETAAEAKRRILTRFPHLAP